MKKDWIYYGIFFSDNTKRAILDFAKKQMAIYQNKSEFDFPEDWKIYCDHMTLVYNNGSNAAQEDADFYENVCLNQNVSLQITHIGIGKTVVALKVDYKTANKISHITVACAPNVKPVTSNTITNWYKTNETFYVTGKVRKVVGNTVKMK